MVHAYSVSKGVFVVFGMGVAGGEVEVDAPVRGEHPEVAACEADAVVVALASGVAELVVEVSRLVEEAEVAAVLGAQVVAYLG